MNTERQDRAFQILADRQIWENKQRQWYLMRHDGLRRTIKPWPTAADLHFPMVDMQIADLKPFWIAQAFGGERLADFVCLKEQLGSTTEAAADWFDFQMRYFTQYRYVMEQAVDTMLLRGRGIIYAVTDPFNNYRLSIKSVDPLYILMPEQSDDFDTADYFVHVQRLTVPQYKRNRNYNQDPATLSAIRGKRDYNFQAILNDKILREGITHSQRDDEIMIWNYYERRASGWLVNTFSPQAWDKPIRDDYMIPYTLDGQTSLPLKSITMEIKDEGWYAPRGLAELNAAFEAYACKLWNEKADAMTFGNRPIFTGDKDLNTANMRINPGDYIPGNITAVQMPQPAMSFSEEINFARSLSEQRSRTPDFGQFSPDQGQGDRPITATQSRISAGLQAVGADHNGDVFRQVRLLAIYKHFWALMLHADESQRLAGHTPELSYFMSDNLKELTPQAFHDRYLVIPSGGSANKQVKLQRAVARYQLLRGAPNVDQDGLVRNLLAADDSRLVSKLLIPMNQKQADEAYQEDVELMVMAAGRPVPVLPGQDHATRIQECVGYLHAQHVKGVAPDPMAIPVIQQHVAEHFAYLKQANPQAAKALMMQVKQMEGQAGAGNGNGNGNGAPAGAMPSPGGTAPQGQAQEQSAEPPKLSESISIKLADLYPSERAQVLQQGWGIRAASPEEMSQVEEARAQVKAITQQAKPKVEGALA